MLRPYPGGMQRILAMAILAALIGAGSAFAQGPPLSREQPIAVGAETIGLDEIRHWARIAARTAGSRPSQQLGAAADLLIQQRWIEGEARALGIRVSAARVAREFRRQRRASFPSLRRFRRFLADFGYTRADLLGRVRIDLLTTRIRDRVLRGVPEAEQEERLEAWVADFRVRWQALTRCTPRFAALVDEESCAQP
jgi:SurA N-terminal domain